MRKSLIVLCLFGALASCTKEKNVTPITEPTPTPTVTNMSLITANSWTLTKIEKTANNVTEDVSASFLDECDKDNFMTFTDKKVLLMDEGQVKCDQEDLQSQAGSWDFMENESKISITMDGSTDNYKIEELKTDKFSISETVTEQGVTTTTKLSFIKKP